MGMQITDVRVRRIEKEGKMKAIVSITLDNEFVVHDIKVIEGEKGLFIAMPSRKAADGEYRDIAHPINSGTRDMIQNVILAKYEATALELADRLECDVNTEVENAHVRVGIDIRTARRPLGVDIDVVEIREKRQQVVPAEINLQRLDADLPECRNIPERITYFGNLQPQVRAVHQSSHPLPDPISPVVFR